MKELEWAYLAGLIDGDGYIGYSCYYVKGKRYKYPRVEIISKDRNFLEKVAKMVGCNYGIRKGNRSWRLSFGLLCSRKILSRIYKYSVLKRKDIYEVLNGIEITRDRTPDFSLFEQGSNIIQAYFAGFFDAEGSATIVKKGKNSYGFLVRVSQKNEDFLDGISQRMGWTKAGFELIIPHSWVFSSNIFVKMIKNEWKKKVIFYYSLINENWERSRYNSILRKERLEIYENYKYERDLYYGLINKIYEEAI